MEPVWDGTCLTGSALGTPEQCDEHTPTRPTTTSVGGSVVECEVLVDGAYGGGAFANRGRDALHRARPEVANGEQAGPAGLERKRATTCNLPTVVKMLVIERQVSEHKAVFVKRAAAG